MLLPLHMHSYTYDLNNKQNAYPLKKQYFHSLLLQHKLSVIL